MADIAAALQYANAPEDQGVGVNDQGTNPNATFHLTPDAQQRITDINQQQLQKNGGRIDIAAALQHAADDTTPQVMPTPVSPRESFLQGTGDIFYGLGRAAQHLVPDSWLNGVRGALGWNPVSTPQWDQLATQREQQYDQARAQAGQNGIDWWRLGGNVANPVNYLTGGQSAAESVLGRVAQATGQGAVLGGLQGGQQSSLPSHYWWDAAKGAITGGATGGALGGLVEAVSPVLSYATNKIRSLVGNDPAQTSAAADSVIKSTLQNQGVDPNSVDLNLLKGMRQDVESALNHGADISPQSIMNRAIGESLPFPVQFTRGQATGDAMQFAREQNLRGIEGVGNPITQRLTDQNNAFINNLDALGAKNAMNPVALGTNIKSGVQNFWDGLEQAKNNLYAQVKNSAGQSSAMDGITAADNIKSALNTPEQSYAYDLLPTNIQKTIDDLGSGKMPFNVAQMQSLDKQWGAMARSSQDGSTRYAINQARSILNNAPIIDDTGQAARDAYNAARAAHAQQMSLVTPKQFNGLPNPNYQPLVDNVVYKDIAPENIFSKFFTNAPASEAQGHLNFLTNNVDPNAASNISNTLMGEVKRNVLNNAGDNTGRAIVSEAKMKNWVNDPGNNATLQALLPQSAYNTFNNLAHAVTIAKKAPVAAAVNTSNTGSALVNAGLSMAKGPIGTFLKKAPILKNLIEPFNAVQTQSAVENALNPGVTLKQLYTSTPQQALNKRLLQSFGTTALVPSQEQPNGPNQ